MTLVGCNSTRPIIAALPLAVHHTLPTIDKSEFKPTDDDNYWLVHKSTIKKILKRDAMLRKENDTNRSTLLRTHESN